MLRGDEFHSIIYSIFDGDVKGLHESEQVQANCPRCQQREGLSYPDGKYNLEINTAKRMFRCWKCDEPKFSGSLGRLVRMFGRESDYALYKSYAGQFFDYAESDDEKEFGFVSLPKEFIPFSEMDINNIQHLEAYNYLVLERKIDFQTVINYRIGFCVDGDYFGRIIIPSYDQFGELNYFVARSYKNLKPTYQNPKVDKDWIIFNEGLINWDSTIYIVEGTFEMLSFPVNIVPQLGKTLSKAFLQKLKEKKPNVVIVLDPDAYKNAVEMFEMISTIYGDDKDRIKIVKLTGVNDLDEIRRKFGKSAVIEKLRTARQLEVSDYFLFKKYFPYERKGYRTKSYSGNTMWK